METVIEQDAITLVMAVTKKKKRVIMIQKNFFSFKIISKEQQFPSRLIISLKNFVK